MFKEILLPIDLGEEASSKKALAAAVELCKSHGARLHVLAVVPGFGMSIISQYFPEDFEEKALADAMKRLEAYIAKNVPSDITSQAVVASGTVYEEILQVVKKTRCDLVIVTAHRPDLKDFLLGSNASQVVHHAKCSVLVVRD